LDVKKDFWKQSSITNEIDVRKLEKDRGRNYQGKGCLMLVFDNKKAVCELHRRFGFLAKPQDCQDAPFGSLCLREYKEKQLRNC